MKNALVLAALAIASMTPAASAGPLRHRAQGSEALATHLIWDTSAVLRTLEGGRGSIFERNSQGICYMVGRLGVDHDMLHDALLIETNAIKIEHEPFRVMERAMNRLSFACRSDRYVDWDAIKPDDEGSLAATAEQHIAPPQTDEEYAALAMEQLTLFKNAAIQLMTDLGYTPPTIE